MSPIPSGKTVKVIKTLGISPSPAPEIGAEGIVMRWDYMSNGIILTVDIAGKVYWIPQVNVEVV